MGSGVMTINPARFQLTSRLLPLFLAGAAFTVLFIMLVFTPSSLRAEPLQTFSTATLTIVSGGKPHPFTVELATTDPQRVQGLMFRPTLAPDHGMLFLYSRARVINMWMKNTYIPLDMLFLNSEGRIVALHERAVPESLQTISSGIRVRAVIEVPGGTVQRLGIRIGDQVKSSFFGTQ